MANRKVEKIVDGLVRQPYLEGYELYMRILLDITTEENVAEITTMILTHPDGSELDYALFLEEASERDIQEVRSIIPPLLDKTVDRDARESLYIAMQNLS